MFADATKPANMPLLVFDDSRMELCEQTGATILETTYIPWWSVEKVHKEDSLLEFLHMPDYHSCKIGSSSFRQSQAGSTTSNTRQTSTPLSSISSQPRSPDHCRHKCDTEPIGVGQESFCFVGVQFEDTSTENIDVCIDQFVLSCDEVLLSGNVDLTLDVAQNLQNMPADVDIEQPDQGVSS